MREACCVVRRKILLTLEKRIIRRLLNFAFPFKKETKITMSLQVESY